MLFKVTYSQIGDDPNGPIHRRRQKIGSDTNPGGSMLDCGRSAGNGLWLHAIHWNRETACFGCWNHLLTLVDGDNTTWQEAATAEGEPSGLFHVVCRPGKPDLDPGEPTPMAEIVRQFGLSEMW